MKPTLGLLLIILISLLSYVKLPAQQFQKVLYTKDAADFFNPERGFYRSTITYVSKYEPLTAAVIQQFTKPHEPFEKAGFKVTISLVHRVFVLEGFQEKTLSEELLTKINADFSAAREAGVKLIVRFCYNFTPSADFSPPYKDASLEIVTKHIQQLKPILQSNKDVIAVIQQGFIGLWGEGYYTDHFGIPGSKSYSKQNIIDRATMLHALLGAAPKDRIVQARTPTAVQDYQRIFKQNLTRVGLHNDAFLGSQDDLGTFRSYDVGSLLKTANTPNILRSYVKKLVPTTVMGGETSTFNPPTCKCAIDGGKADAELKDYQYSYLNSTYNQQVIKSWLPCIDAIKKSLGYRFYLKDLTLPKEVSKGGYFKLNANIVNEGYASPYNYRTVYLALSNLAGNKNYLIPLQANLLKWYPGNISINERLKIDRSIPSGKYKLSLYLPDADPKIAKNVSYAIRFANVNMWKANQGFNDLSTTITVN